MKFLIRLIEQLNNFDLKKAEALSVEIHEAESKGYNVSKREDKYWQEITEKILKYNR
jgi:hypothetical protein